MNGLDSSPPAGTRLYGLYRGKVVTVVPNGVAVSCPAVTGSSSVVGFARMCYTGEITSSALPQAGDNVWIMFEHGEVDSPVVMGRF